MIRWLKRELPRIIPVFLFFLIFFTVINWTETYLFEQAGITPFKFAEIAVSALLIAKIVLVANLLPFIALFQKKPLIYSILWKTFIYWTLLILVRIGIRIISDWGITHADLHAMHWNLFISIQAFYFLLLFVFVSFQELAFKIGPAKMRLIFFGF